ncbi:hypothetical protein [Demequina sp. SO4-18]|uniref:hypothetical protein n=1 Tax=Demequina sp. SO4-18 TaxID=3401026 RepID=UPI003B5A66B5
MRVLATYQKPKRRSPRRYRTEFSTGAQWIEMSTYRWRWSALCMAWLDSRITGSTYRAIDTKDPA